MFKYRLISTIILIPCTVTMLFLLPILQFKFLTLSICMLSAWEWGILSKLPSSEQNKWLLLMFILLLIILQTSNHQFFFYFKNNQYIIYITLIWWTIALLLILFYPSSSILWKQSTLLWKIFGMLIILPFFWGVLILRSHCYNDNHYIGSWLLLYVMTIVWGVDSFAYIIGNKLGYNQITPKISPRKTWEGYLGGLLIMIPSTWLLSKYIPINIESSKLFFYSIIIMLSSILGDLTESMFKRVSNVKDSGQMIPGHGGILDLIDGLYSTIPIFVCLMLLTIDF